MNKTMRIAIAFTLVLFCLTALLMPDTGCGEGKPVISSGYVCGKHFEPAHGVKPHIPDAWTVDLSENETCASDWRHVNMQITQLNYNMIEVGDRVRIDEKGAMFPVKENTR